MNNLPSSFESIDSFRPFAGVRLVALDIDGTLASVPSAELAEQICDLAKSLKYYGVRVTIATGRAMAGAKRFAERLATAPIILYNGALIVDGSTNELLFRRSIDFEALMPMLLTVREMGLSCYVYDATCAVTQLLPSLEARSSFDERVFGFGPTIEAPEFNGLSVQWLDHLPHDVAATALLIPTPSDAVQKQHLVSIFEMSGVTSVTSSGSHFVEVRPAGVNKADALERVAGWLGLSGSQVLVIGDNDNDREMFEWAGIGVAVKNATETILNTAQYFSDGEAGAGVIEALRATVHAKRYFKHQPV
jgi:Cof subfamily protein (haloacid dehalogenase superfamily)